MMVKRKKGLLQRCREHWQLLLFMLPPMIYLIIFKYIPMFGIQLAFKKFQIAKGIWGSPWVGFYNFQKFFQSFYFERVLRNTLTVSFYSLIAGFPLPIIIALSLNVIERGRFKKAVETILYMPHFISTVVLVGILFQILNIRIGIYGTIFRSITGHNPVDILASAKSFVHLYVWSGIWQNMGWDTIIYTAALSSVDPELHEAAQIDGANRFQRVINIDLPCILPTAAILLIMSCGHIMSIGFEKVYIMQNDANLVYSEVISTYSYKVGLSGQADFGRSTAISLFNSIINMCMLLFVNQITKRLNSTSLF